MTRRYEGDKEGWGDLEGRYVEGRYSCHSWLGDLGWEMPVVSRSLNRGRFLVLLVHRQYK